MSTGTRYCRRSTNIEDIIYYAFCKMLSACDMYVYKTKVPTLFHSKENIYLQIVLVLKQFQLILIELFHVLLLLVQNTHPKPWPYEGRIYI